MYSRQYFVELFSESDTDELLDRLATADLTDEAKDAIHSVLRERGISNKELESRILKAKKSQFRSTSPTKECDFCGKSTRFSAIKNEGQKFCSKNCLRNARLMEAAIDISEGEILRRALEIKNGPCPSCRGWESKIEIRKSYWVWVCRVLYLLGYVSRDLLQEVRSAVQSDFNRILFALRLVGYSVGSLHHTYPDHCKYRGDVSTH